MIKELTMIRAAVNSDASQIYQLMVQLQLFAGMEIIEEAAFTRQFSQVLADPRFRAFVAEESGAIKGVITVWLRESLFHGGPVALIDELIILPTHNHWQRTFLLQEGVQA